MHQKIIAIDLGLKRIGVAYAVGDILIPLQPILRRNRQQAAQDVKNILNEKEADLLVVGMLMEGESAIELKRRMEHFIHLLELKIPVVYVDESYSSKEAMQRSQGVLKDKQKRGYLDSLAAMVILERYYQGRHQEERVEN